MVFYKDAFENIINLYVYLQVCALFCRPTSNTDIHNLPFIKIIFITDYCFFLIKQNFFIAQTVDITIITLKIMSHRNANVRRSSVSMMCNITASTQPVANVFLPATDTVLAQGFSSSVWQAAGIDMFNLIQSWQPSRPQHPAPMVWSQASLHRKNGRLYPDMEGFKIERTVCRKSGEYVSVLK